MNNTESNECNWFYSDPKISIRILFEYEMRKIGSIITNNNKNASDEK